ncbi:hypothetical protein [Micromonospora lupini]|uniref:hypothetical protein n=1 Tax=Micromonospora lupini TaxID=285679 RepID=UPI0033F0E425
MTIGFRVTRSDEVTGVDQILHTESAYDFATTEADTVPAGTIGTWSHSPTARHQSVGDSTGPSAR